MISHSFWRPIFLTLAMNSVAVISLSSFCPIIFKFPPSVAYLFQTGTFFSFFCLYSVQLTRSQYVNEFSNVTTIQNYYNCSLRFLILSTLSTDKQQSTQINLPGVVLHLLNSTQSLAAKRVAFNPSLHLFLTWQLAVAADGFGTVIKVI